MLRAYPAASPHGDVEEIFEDVFFVTGSVIMAPELQISRNMIIIREGSSLTLISSVRLDDEGLRKLDALGKVENVIKLGAYHLGVKNGIDDPFYVDRYNAKLWAMPGMEHARGLKTTNIMKPNEELPFANASLFSYETSKRPEGLILLDREEGILVACDSLQNWVEADRFFSEKGATMMQNMGFIRAANAGPEWLRECQAEPTEFQRVLSLNFCHLLPSHGKPIKNTAKDEFSVTFKKLFGVEIVWKTYKTSTDKTAQPEFQ